VPKVWSGNTVFSVSGDEWKSFYHYLSFYKANALANHQEDDNATQLITFRKVQVSAMCWCLIGATRIAVKFENLS
jgi:hypothetical protein